MAKSKLISRIGALALAAALACTSLISASAATIDKATIDMDAKAQLSIYKYDFTNAKKDGVWDEDSYVSTGQYDAKVNEVLGGTTRTGANSASSALGNGQASNGYAIKGVEYTYLKIADITQFTESEKAAVVPTATLRCCMQSIKSKAQICSLLSALQTAKTAMKTQMHLMQTTGITSPTYLVQHLKLLLKPIPRLLRIRSKPT